MAEEEKSEESEERRKTGIRIPVPWSKEPIEVRGLGTILTLSLIAVCLTAYMVYDVKAQMPVEHQKIVVAVDSLKEATMEQTYVLSLDETQRKNLDLRMPPSLRAKQRRRGAPEE